MKYVDATPIIFVTFVLIQTGASLEIKRVLEPKSELAKISDDMSRDRRGVIEEEKFYNIRSDSVDDTHSQPTPWLPQPLPPEEDPTTKISITNEVKEPPMFYTTEKVTDKPTGRGARASNENWIKLPYPPRDEVDRDLAPPQPSGELLNSRMPRINFVTQNKQLDASESRNDKESIQRAGRDDILRTDIINPKEDDRAKSFRPVYPRQAVYYPEESRRSYYPESRYYPADELYRRDPYYDTYDRRRYNDYPRYGPRVDRYDEVYDNNLPRKPKRIIYYAHLPEVVRTPPSVDLTQRFAMDPYRRPEDDYYARAGRYDYRFRNRYPYAPLRKEERIYRDLTGAGTSSKDKKLDEKITANPIMPEKQDKYKKVNINSHQYHDNTNIRYDEPITHKSYSERAKPNHDFLRYEAPLFHSATDEQYRQRY